MFPNPQRFLGFYTTRRTLFGRILRVDRHKVRAFAFTLVFQHPLERPPRRRCSVSRVTGEFDQSFRIQVLNSHEIVFSGVVVRQFMQEISSLPFEIGVALGDNLPLFLLAVRPMFFP